MPLAIDEAAFESCHENFLDYMREKANGEAFTNFQHPFLVKDEISYKWAAYRNGLDALSLDNWKKWKPGDGRIIQAVKRALRPSIQDCRSRRVEPLFNSDGASRLVEREAVRLRHRGHNRDSFLHVGVSFLRTGHFKETQR